MKLIKTFNQEKCSDKEVKNLRIRIAVRGIVTDDDNNVAILFVSSKDFYSLSGGGVEKSETIEDGFIRECWEEIGCKVKIESEAGQIDEIRISNNLINRTYCYTAKIVGEKGKLNLVQDELEDGIELLWVDIDKAIQLISEYPESIDLYYKYALERDIAFLREAKKVVI